MKKESTDADAGAGAEQAGAEQALTGRLDEAIKADQQDRRSPHEALKHIEAQRTPKAEELIRDAFADLLTVKSLSEITPVRFNQWQQAATLALARIK